MSVPVRQWLFRRWYLKARRQYPQLPPWNTIRVRYSRLRNELAHIEYDIQDGKILRARIRINDDFCGGGWKRKQTFRSFAHELAHIVYPKIEHGSSFEHKIVNIKAVMEENVLWL